MTQYLPPNLLALFAPRDPIPFLPPASKLPHEKKSKGYEGVGCFLSEFEVRVLENPVGEFLMGNLHEGSERDAAADSSGNEGGAAREKTQGKGRTGGV